MQRQRKVLMGKLCAVASVVPVLIYAYETGPDPRKTGAPGDGICSEAGCHVGTANSGPGSVKVTFPGGLTYAPGAKQRWIVTVSDPNQRRWGFQLSTRLSSNTRSAQAGDLTPADGFTQVICENNVARPASGCRADMPLQFIEHTESGTRTGTTGSLNFEFDWTPPATDSGNVMVYVAGNAANGDRQNSGDRIYTASYTLSPAAGGGSRPAITASGVVNGASFQPTISQKSWVTIRGTNLSATTRLWGGSDIVDGKLPTQLDGVSVTINGKPAYVEFISPTQINVAAPADDSTGPVQVQVKNSSGTSDNTTAQMQTFSPALFLFDGKYVAALHADNSPVGKAGLIAGATFTPAKPGEVVVLYGNGFGPTDPVIPGGQLTDKLANLATPLTIRFGDTGVTPLFAGLVPPYAVLYQFNVRIPDSAPDGDLPVVATLGGASSPNSSSCCFITVQK